jgi:hypothetical protein
MVVSPLDARISGCAVCLPSTDRRTAGPKFDKPVRKFSAVAWARWQTPVRTRIGLDRARHIPAGSDLYNVPTTSSSSFALSRLACDAGNSAVTACSTIMLYAAAAA